MAENKRTFIAYCDWLKIFDELEDDEAGRLAKHLFRYVNDLNPEAPDRFTKMLFIQIQTMLKLDLRKWDKYIEKQKINGAKGGRPKTQINPNKPKPFLENPTKPKKADTVTVTDTVTDKETLVEERESSNTPEFIPPPLTPVSLLPIDECHAMATKEQTWVESVCMHNPITLEQFEYDLTDFDTKVKADGTDCKLIRDYKQHFNNWLKYEIKYTQKNAAKTNKRDTDAAQRETNKRNVVAQLSQAIRDNSN